MLGSLGSTGVPGYFEWISGSFRVLSEGGLWFSDRGSFKGFLADCNTAVWKIRWGWSRVIYAYVYIYICTYREVYIALSLLLSLSSSLSLSLSCPLSTYAYIYVYIHTCIHTYIHVCLHACVRATFMSSCALWTDVLHCWFNSFNRGGTEIVTNLSAFELLKLSILLKLLSFKEFQQIYCDGGQT